jgi:hypothetical protein
MAMLEGQATIDSDRCVNGDEEHWRDARVTMKAGVVV